MSLSIAQHLHIFVDLCLKCFLKIAILNQKSIKTTYKNMKIKHMGMSLWWQFGGSFN